MYFRLTARSMTFDDHEIELYISSTSERIWRDFADLGRNNCTAKLMKIEPYRQRQRCNH